MNCAFHSTNRAFNCYDVISFHPLDEKPVLDISENFTIHEGKKFRTPFPLKTGS